MKLQLTLVATLLLSATSLHAAPPTSQPSPPAKYDADTTIDEKPLPPLPKLGPANSILKDPTFGTRILRVTDEKTSDGRPLHTPSAGEHNTFNADSTMFLVYGGIGGTFLYKFDKATFQAQRATDPKNPAQPLILSEIHGEPFFSYTDPNLLYGPSAQGHKIIEYNVATGATRDLLDLDKLLGKDAVRIGQISPSYNGCFAVNFGGMRQNEDTWEAFVDPKTNTTHLLDSLNNTLDGKPIPSKISSGMHNSHIDLSGRYVICTFSRNAGMMVGCWDVTAGAIYPAEVFRDHRANGFANALSNAGLCALTPEGVQSPKPFNTAMQKTAIVQGVDRHWSWNNQRPDASLPAFVSNYSQAGRQPQNKILLDEIDAVSTDSSNTIYRFAHHRSTYRGGFWDSPRGNVSPDGRYYMFTSNWEETVGKGRQDLFIVELTRTPGTFSK